MSIIDSLTPEIEDLFDYTDSDGRLEQESLEEAGFTYRQDLGELELWEKNETQIRYNPDTNVIEDYTDL